ncbi:hypothetical protein GCM10007989_27640 [Devosia pacifica]|uniref:Protein kinase domain-containing protein n=1 Tax=Devosia pacifica TaxID=1335967 RepID=A0A918S8P6_9HYPH|nr:aminoglycoside phosphotransferase family protein [Devosia pacifica]GHA30364.1 hypothetical protein GCM10007989_27640 [Devosia pacifica]
MLAPDHEENVILRRFGLSQARLIGEGGEARVFALDENRVLRIARPGASMDSLRQRQGLAAEIAKSAHHLPFATPHIETVEEVEGRAVAVERRLAGVPLAHLFETIEGRQREAVLTSYLDASAAIQTIIPDRPYVGELGGGHPVRADSYQQYLGKKLEAIRAEAPETFFAALGPDIVDALPDCDAPALVHFDMFAGNVLIADGRVSAVLDFGETTLIADPALESWSVVAYLDPQISPNARPADRALAMAWLERRGLAAAYPAARRFIAAAWTHAHDDPAVMAWCRSILIEGR